MKNVFLVASGKGGVGKSSVTAFVGRSLVKLNKKVLLIDLDVSLRSLDLLLGVSEKCVYDWGDALEERTQTAQAIVAGENGNPDLLCAPVSFSQAISEKGLEPIVSEVRDGYDFIFLDAPAGVGEMLALGSKVADRALVVATPDEVCVRSAGVAADKMREFGFEGETRLIINRFRKKESRKGRLLNADSVIDKTYVRLIGIVPEDNAVAFCSVTQKPLPPRNPAALAFSRIARRLTGENVELKNANL